MAIVSDGSMFRRDLGASVLSSVLNLATLLREHAGIATTAALVTAEDDHQLGCELRRLTADVGGVYLTHTDPGRAHATQNALAGEVSVITEAQATAVVVVAAIANTLARAGTTPDNAHVVIVGAERNPLVAALTAGVGIGEVTSRGAGDAQEFPLNALARRADVVVDLMGEAPRHAGLGAADGPPVIAVDDSTVPLLALPGLWAAIATSRSPAGHADCLAAALDLAAAAPAEQLLPDLSEPRFTPSRPQ